MNPDDRPAKTTPFNVATLYQELPYSDVREIANERRLPYAVATANITGDLNIGVIIRTACVFAATEVFMFGKKKYDRRSTVGAHHYLDLHHYESKNEQDLFDWTEALQIIRVNGYIPVIIEQGGTSIEQFIPRNIPGKICLVFGAEDCGIPEDVCRNEYWFTIPQPGILRSLNVSTAAGIAIFHTAYNLGFSSPAK